MKTNTPTPPFTVSIPRCREVPEPSKDVVYYVIEVTKSPLEKFNIEKRYNEFDTLDKKLKEDYVNLPLLPGKSYITIDRVSKIQRRREGLEKYLQELIAKEDILSSPLFIDFLQLGSFAPEATVHPPKHLGDLDGFSMGIRDFIYQSSERLLFVATGEMRVRERVNSFFKNMKKVWDPNAPEETLKTIGTVECFIQEEDLNKEVQFKRLWCKKFVSQVICLEWDQLSCQLFIGDDSGTLTVLSVPMEEGYAQYKEILSYKLHQARVMNLIYDSISDYIYSASKDLKFKVFDLEQKAVVADQYCGDHQYTFEQKGFHEVSFGAFDSGKYKLTGLVGGEDSKRVILANKAGRVFIYNIQPQVPELVHSFQAHEKGAIRGLCFDPVKSYLIVPDYEDGMISFYDTRFMMADGSIKKVANLQGKPKVRCVVWLSAKTELYCGGEDGNITFWNVKKTVPMYIMKAHAQGVTKLMWVEESNILISAGKDRKISFYALPEKWKDSVDDIKPRKPSDMQKEEQKLEL